MSAVRIVTDSASDLTDEQASALGIEIVPLSIRFGDTEYTDRVDLTVAGFYETMARSDELPQTAAPSPGAFETVFRRLGAEGATAVVCINLSRALSATGEAAQQAATAVAGDVEVHCVDSKSITCGLGTIVLHAAQLAANGASATAVVAAANDLSERTHVYGVLDTLENLKKGGRIGGAQAMVGTMLSIKPLLDLSTGEVQEAGRQRTRKKALAWLRDKVSEAMPVEDLAISGAAADDLHTFVASFEGIIDVSEIRVGDVGAVIGTHGGSGIIGMSFTVPATS